VLGASRQCKSTCPVRCKPGIGKPNLSTIRPE
jgi:hypothetical protein